MQDLVAHLPDWLQPLAVMLVSVIAALLLHKTAMVVLRRAARRIPLLRSAEVVKHLCRPLRWLFVAFALAASQPALGLDAHGTAIWRQVTGLLFPALLGWLLIALMTISLGVITYRTDVSVADNLAARRRRTRAGILHRILVLLILLATFCLMLMSIPAVRSIGVTLIASAGLAGLAVGAAAQPALKNLIAGIQMAFTEPIRLDDVVILDGEWGRIEEIRLTFVVVKIWDERRLVVPVTRFLEGSFENWTRQTSELLGTAFLRVDPTADVPRLRARLQDVVRTNPNWDGRVVGLQVTELAADHMELRALVSASDATRAFDLRCDVREALMAFIRDEMPEALARRRNVLEASPHPLSD
ncbi:mechanosensitive ion channel family protein [Sphingomonas xinjiangensis]|uniref:Small-conductance mechanosensitive channel n=1 Tax=Sphingomonas xinjiangensis TaxID=643568 RepID=A0A840YNR8_9SPHN|nr:mechanosensitive ion channel domain-containing protein [Sphingomonas xinjiangensis]MBB5708843.1 small-conductance mechanosensitive channel [Sphingomonas xinjiangensis]